MAYSSLLNVNLRMFHNEISVDDSDQTIAWCQSHKDKNFQNLWNL